MANLSDLLGGGAASGVLDEQVFDASGTWTKPEDTADSDIVEIEMWGAAGGGGRGSGSNDFVYSGDPGAYARLRLFARDLNLTEAVTVGAGGAGATAYTSGGSGGDTIISNLVMPGGAGGQARSSAITNFRPNVKNIKSKSGSDVFRGCEYSDHSFGSISQQNYSPADYLMCGGYGGSLYGGSQQPDRTMTAFGGQAGDFANNNTIIGDLGTNNGQSPGGSGGGSYSTSSRPGGNGGNGRVTIRVLKGGV